MNEEPKKIEIVSGNGKNLNISDVFTHLSIAKPKIKDEKKEKILIPQIKKNKDNKK